MRNAGSNRSRIAWQVVTALCLAAWSAPVHADDLVDHIVRSGGASRRAASSMVNKVSRVMVSNADRGGEDYDRIRQAVGMALFGASGPGNTRAEYNTRLAQVLARLEGGLNMWALPALFGPESMANCREDFGLSAPDCRALAKAAARVPAIDADGLLAEARTAFQSENYERAAEAYAQVTFVRPDEAAAFAGLGQSLVRTGDGRGAVRALRRAIELAPNVANLRAYLGRALIATGDLAAATTAFREALALNAGHADAKAGLRELEAASARAPQQRSAPAPVVAAAPASAPPASAPRFGTPRFGTPAPAATVVAPQPPSSAAPAFGGAQFGGGRTAAGPDPVARQWVQKGEAHLQARQFPQAVSAFQMGASLDPGHAPAFAGLGAAHAGAGDRAGAARALQTAVRLAPDSADYHAALGNALAGTGDRDTAVAAFRRALSLVPGHRVATAGLAQLEGGAAPVVATPAAPAAPAAPARFGGGAVSTVAVAPQAATPAPAPAPAPAPVAPPPAPAPVRAAPTPAPVVAAAPPPAPEPEPEPEPVLEDDLIAGLLSSPLGGSGGGSSRGGSSSRAAAAAPVAAPSTPAAGALPQSPSREQISAVMRDLLSTVKACMGDETGVVQVQITIAGDSGAVTDASTVGRDQDDPAGICVAEVVRGASFPRFSKPSLSIKYPFQL